MKTYDLELCIDNLFCGLYELVIHFRIFAEDLALALCEVATLHFWLLNFLMPKLRHESVYQWWHDPRR